MPLLSPSTRKAWIEIDPFCQKVMPLLCRLPHGRRGLKSIKPLSVVIFGERRLPHGRRGLKLCVFKVLLIISLSPSTRKAWIEIYANSYRIIYLVVAFHTEGVDWNKHINFKIFVCVGSPSTRKAWIEIMLVSLRREINVSPSTRKAWIEISAVVFADFTDWCRLPHGRRGLK